MAVTLVDTPTDEAASGTATIASMARDWAQRAPGQVAMREKDLGIWQEYTWERTWELVLDAANGLLALGVETGDRVSIQSEDRPEWVILDLATVAVRGVTVGLYPTNPTAEVEYLLMDSTSTVHFAEDQEQVDRALEVDPSKIPSLNRILYTEPRGLRDYDDPRLLAWKDFLELGRRHRRESPDAVELRMADARPDDLMTLVYTSGTTGPPKGAMLSNANVGYAISVFLGENGLRGDRVPGPGDLVLTYLPLCHVAERIFSTWHLVACGISLNFAESIDTVIPNLREIQPTLFFAVPRIWEKMHASVLIRGSDASRLEMEHRRAVEDIIDFLEIERWRRHPVALLPYGFQKRVELGRALAMQPELLMLDEPVAGMNLEETEDMARFILDIRQELGISIVLVEHDMGLVMDIADRVLVLDFGEMIFMGPPGEVQRDPAVIAVYLGDEAGFAAATE